MPTEPPDEPQSCRTNGPFRQFSNSPARLRPLRVLCRVQEIAGKIPQMVNGKIEE